MRKETENRYNSAEQFAEDVKNYLAGLPVKAYPQSLNYRVSKFVRRNKLAVAGTAAALFLIIFGATAAIWQASVARQQQQIAEQRFEQVRKVANSLIFEYNDELAKLEGSTKLREKLVVDAVNYLDAISQGEQNDPELLKELAVAYRKIGEVQGGLYETNLGKLDESMASFQKSIDLLEKAVEINPEEDSYKIELTNSLKMLSQAYMRTGNNADAISNIERAVEISESVKDKQSLEAQLRTLDLKLQVADKIDDLNKRFEKYSENIPTIESLQSQYNNNDKLIRLHALYGSRAGNAAKWMGFDAERMNDSESANKYYLISLGYQENVLQQTLLYESLYPADAKTLRRNFVAYANLSDIYVRLNDFKEAEANLKITREILSKLQSDADNQEADVDELGILNTEQDFFIKQDKIKSAVELIDKSLNLVGTLARQDPKNAEIVMYGFHISEKAADLMRNQKNETAAGKYFRRQSEYERKLRQDYDYKGEMRFYF